MVGNSSDSLISVYVYIHAVLMIISGSLVIADVKIGGLLMSLAMVIQVATKDNPLLANSDL